MKSKLRRSVLTGALGMGVAMTTVGQTRGGFREVVKVAGLRAEDVWTDGQALKLVHAVTQNDVSAIESLVKAGVPVDVRGKADWTPLAWGTSIGSLEAMEALLKLGANPNHRTQEKTIKDRPIVMLIAEFPDPSSRLKVLLAHGLNASTREGISTLNPTPGEGDSLLMRVVMCRKCVEMLVEQGADINIEFSGGSVLDRAALFGEFSTLEYLLEKGGSVNLTRVAHTLQSVNHGGVAKTFNNPNPPTEAYRVKLLRMLHAKGAKVYPSTMNPGTPAELLSPASENPYVKPIRKPGDPA
jgi:hypothetical protein